MAFEALRRSRGGSRVLAHPVWPRLARGVLVAVFAICLIDLVNDTVILT